MPPQGPNLVLSADIPDVEAGVLVGNGLDVESDGRDGVDFAGGAGRELEGVEDGFEEVLAAVRFPELSRSCEQLRLGSYVPL